MLIILADRLSFNRHTLPLHDKILTSSPIFKNKRHVSRHFLRSDVTSWYRSAPYVCILVRSHITSRFAVVIESACTCMRDVRVGIRRD